MLDDESRIVFPGPTDQFFRFFACLKDSQRYGIPLWADRGLEGEVEVPVKPFLPGMYCR